MTTLGLSDTGIGTYSYKYTFVTAARELPIPITTQPTVVARKLYIDGHLVPLDVPQGASHYTHTDADPRGGDFTFPKR